VILCKFPHAAATLSKIRPALVEQSDYYNQRIANLLVAGVTGNLANVNDSAHLLIDITTSAGQQSGLKCDSLASCINLAVIPPRHVDRKIGESPDDMMQQIDQCLKAAMGIS